VPSFRATTAGPPIYTWGVFAFVITAVAAGAIAGLFHWAAKTTGRPLPDAVAKLLALVLLAGGVIFGVPFLVLGFADRYDAIVEAPATFSITALIGALIVLVAVAVATALTIIARLAVIGGGSTAEADPWGTGPTLEWLTDSPPAPGNFAEVPEILSPEPLLDANDGGAR
jgi:heme/copper-type cytochrome/quinol oxidase subunit 1